METKVIQFGEDRESRNILCKDIKLIWTTEFTSLGINYDILDLNRITELNLKPKLHEIEKLCTI